MSLTIHSKYKYFDSTVQRVEERWQNFHFSRLPFAVNVMLNLSIMTSVIPTLGNKGPKIARSNVRNRLKFGNISRNYLLCTKI